MATTTKPQRPQVSLRPEMDEKLERLSNLSGLPKVEIIARALDVYEPRVVEAAKHLSTENEPVANEPAAT